MLDISKTANTPIRQALNRHYKDILENGREAVERYGYIPQNHSKCNGTGIQGRVPVQGVGDGNKVYYVICDCVLKQMRKREEIEREKGIEDYRVNWEDGTESEKNSAGS